MSNRLLIILVSVSFLLSPTVSFANTMSSSTSNASEQEPPAKKAKLEETPADEASEHLKPWLSRWTEGRIGFHLDEVNPILLEYERELLGLPPSKDDGETEKEDKNSNSLECSKARVLVPLCGKTVDLAHLVPLTQHVYGVEGIRSALEDFAKEHSQLNVKPIECKDSAFERFQGDKITLLKGDFFDLDSKYTDGKVDVIFDRAAMVAIEPPLRPDYVQVLGKVLASKGKILLAVLERRTTIEEARTRGPPFTMPEDVVRSLFEDLDWVDSVQKLQEKDMLVERPQDRERYADLDALMQTVYMIQAK